MGREKHALHVGSLQGVVFFLQMWGCAAGGRGGRGKGNGQRGASTARSLRRQPTMCHVLPTNVEVCSRECVETGRGAA